jgi:hypothetical protein
VRVRLKKFAFVTGNIGNISATQADFSKLRTKTNRQPHMTLDLANITKADVYAAAQDLGERLARQIELNQVLRDENAALASRPCLACEVVHPALHERRLDLEAHFEKACELLNQVDVDTVGLTYGSIVSFIRDRRELNAARRPTNAQEA